MSWRAQAADRIMNCVTLIHASLTCDGLTLRRNDRFTLGPLDFSLHHGVTCLVGPNGAGKTTLFRLLTGLDKPTAGSLSIARDGARMGYLPQDPDLPGQASCRQFLDYVGWLHKIAGDQQRQASDRALAAVGLADKADDKIRALSGGMKRRLGIAQALVHAPELVLLDEPTVGLDPAQRVSLRDTISGLGDDRTLLVSTHLVEDVRGLADRVLVMRDGALIFDGTVAELEDRSDPTALGDTPLERAITALMGVQR